MEPILHFLGAFWWVFVFFVGPAVAGAIARGFRHRERMEMIRQGIDPDAHQRELDAAERAEEEREEREARDRNVPESDQAQHRVYTWPAGGDSPVPDTSATSTAQASTLINRAEAQFQRVNTRWLSYELDLGRLIDFPTMTDVREPLTADYFRAKRRAEALKPLPGVVPSDADAHAYAEAVEAYENAFDLAERNALRLRDTAFSQEDRARLKRARHMVNVAEDEGATTAERQTAYGRARKELEGVIAVPDSAFGELEKQIAAAIEQRQRADFQAEGNQPEGHLREPGH